MAKILKIESGQIRSVFDPETQKTFYSIVDSVGIASGSRDPRNYWKVLKNRLKKTQNQLVTECNQLKMQSSDGKFYLTDSAPASIIVKIVELISPDDIPTFWRYFDNNNQNLSKMRPDSLSATNRVKILSLDKDKSYPQPIYAETENSSANQGQAEEEFSLLVDAYCTNNFIFIKAFTAGVDTENIHIEATPSSISISGSRYVPVQKDNYSITELSWGKFSRTLDLPQNVKEKEMMVTEEDGLLIIKLPLLLQNPNKKIIRMRTI